MRKQIPLSAALKSLVRVLLLVSREECVPTEELDTVSNVLGLGYWEGGAGWSCSMAFILSFDKQLASGLPGAVCNGMESKES